MKEFINIEESAKEPVKKVSEQYMSIYNLEPRDPVTKQGQTAVLPISHFDNISRSLLPRWNRDFAPRRWKAFRDNRKGTQVVCIQRMHPDEINEKKSDTSEHN